MSKTPDTWLALPVSRGGYPTLLALNLLAGWTILGWFKAYRLALEELR